MKLPDPLNRRHLLEGDTPAERCRELADAYLAEGREAEALVFLVKAGATDELEALRERSIASGDAFLTQAATRALGAEPTREQWQRLAAAAAEHGKDAYRELAERQANAESAG